MDMYGVCKVVLMILFRFADLNESRIRVAAASAVLPARSTQTARLLSLTRVSAMYPLLCFFSLLSHHRFFRLSAKNYTTWLENFLHTPMTEFPYYEFNLSFHHMLCILRIQIGKLMGGWLTCPLCVPCFFNLFWGVFQSSRNSQSQKLLTDKPDKAGKKLTGLKQPLLGEQ
jgi:hypothetical protein